MEFYIYDMQFNRLGILDVYVNADFDHKYDNHSPVEITVDATPENSKLLLNNDTDRILTKESDITRGFLIQYSRYEDEDKLRIVITCNSLSVLMGWRLIEGQQTHKGNVEDVIKYFVDKNAINPEDPNRVIPNLVLGENVGIDIETEEAYSNKPLDVSLWDMCKKHNMSYEITMDHTNKKFVFRTFIGIDRSSEQSVNPKVIFSKEFDNIIFQSYVDDTTSYKSTAYVLSGGQESEISLIKVNDDVSGFERRELFVEATDLQRTQTDSGGTSTTMPLEEFEKLLNERGLSTLEDYKKVKTFESDIDLYSQFIYGVHYFLGDIVTSRNDEIGVITHSRVIRARETYNREGYTLKLEFGTSIPTLIDKIKREVRR